MTRVISMCLHQTKGIEAESSCHDWDREKKFSFEDRQGTYLPSRSAALWKSTPYTAVHSIIDWPFSVQKNAQGIQEQRDIRRNNCSVHLKGTHKGGLLSAVHNIHYATRPAGA